MSLDGMTKGTTMHSKEVRGKAINDSFTVVKKERSFPCLQLLEKQSLKILIIESKWHGRECIFVGTQTESIDDVSKHYNEYNRCKQFLTLMPSRKTGTIFHILVYAPFPT